LRSPPLSASTRLFGSTGVSGAMTPGRTMVYSTSLCPEAGPGDASA
jgi:hypothetical protein